jgi:hypothetical protein
MEPSKKVKQGRICISSRQRPVAAKALTTGWKYDSLLSLTYAERVTMLVGRTSESPPLHNLAAKRKKDTK